MAKGPGFGGETRGSIPAETWLKSLPCLAGLTGANKTFAIVMHRELQKQVPLTLDKAILKNFCFRRSLKFTKNN